MRTENKLLREKIDALVRKLYGASSEKLDRGQLLLMLQGLEAPPGKEPEPVAAEAPRRSTDQLPPRERGPRIPEHLPVVEEVIDPEPVKACPQAWRCIGEEVTEQLDFKPAEFFKRRLIRRKYVRREQPFAAPIIAPLQTLQDRCLAAPGLIAALAVGKFVDHVPFYRWERIFESRHGVWLPRQTMAGYMALAADWLRPIYEHIRTGVLGGGYVQIDETRSSICPPATEKPNSVTSGSARAPEATSSSAGKPVERPRAWKRSYPRNGKARSRAMATAATAPLPGRTMRRPVARRSRWPAAGRTRGGPSWKVNRARRGR